jgi:peptide chain release factor 2
VGHVPQAVFDGEIDPFLEAGIRWRRGADGPNGS